MNAHDVSQHRICDVQLADCILGSLLNAQGMSQHRACGALQAEAHLSLRHQNCHKRNCNASGRQLPNMEALQYTSGDVSQDRLHENLQGDLRSRRQNCHKPYWKSFGGRPAAARPCPQLWLEMCSAAFSSHCGTARVTCTCFNLSAFRPAHSRSVACSVDSVDLESTGNQI